MSIIQEFPKIWQEKWEEDGFKEPTAIQEALYPLISEGKSVLGISPTGSGKTLAFMLPLMQRVVKGEGNQILVILPSQELASQVAEVTREWAKPLELGVQTILGGANVKRQLERLKKKPEIIIGTPGRVLELIKVKKIKSHKLISLVLDEVDDLVEDSEYNATKSIIKTLLGETQIVAVSATGERIIPEMEQLFRREPEIVDVTKQDTSKGFITHGYILTPTRKRSEVLRRLAHIEGFKALVFFNQLSEMGTVSERLDFLGIKHQTLASDQHQTERKRAINDFQTGKTPLLLTTDLGARGLDFSDLNYVIQYDIPMYADDYVHRSGRVGRMGKEGVVISLVNDSDKRGLNKLFRELDIQGVELFASHGELLSELPTETIEKPRPEKTKKKSSYVSKTKEVEKKAEQVNSDKKKKKKNRTNRNKNKGASWK